MTQGDGYFGMEPDSFWWTLIFGLLGGLTAAFITGIWWLSPVGVVLTVLVAALVVRQKQRRRIRPSAAVRFTRR
ncbi:hypothetical protein ASE14_08695 [Agromyces sp. Root81]|uniref:hypothetical protein n=1 Tax=Agromyces sp. Root81 TaxID=1736601 RepID=UPI00070035A4|nr:hypothetical protein [Agromyces sp. Root81]KRC61018.1 hypothetical protein ASE14_08695 [Agromyces sp. Root81]